jgi:hypothetical protein
MLNCGGFGLGCGRRGRGESVAPTRVDVDGVDRTDVDTQHAVDTIGLSCRVGFARTRRMIGCFHPVEDVDGAILHAGAVGDTLVEVDRDVGAVDPELVWLVDGPPDIVTVVLIDDLADALEVRVDTHVFVSIEGTRE